MDYTEALDDMTATFVAAWSANAEIIAGYTPIIRYPGIVENTRPPQDQIWGRWFYRTLGQPQSSFRLSKKRTTAFGYCGLQLFAPMSASENLRNAGKLANMVKNALSGHTVSGAVWFRNAKIDELTPDDVSNRLNVVADFEYDELI